MLIGMGPMFENLDDVTRPFMLEELDHDERGPGAVFLSPRLSARGIAEYPDLLRAALTDGSDVSLERALRAPGVMSTQERSRSRTGQPIVKRVPSNAATMIAEGEFNRYYIRGLCARALTEDARVVVYRARPSRSPRISSEAKIGTELDPGALLEDLRASVGREPSILPEVNSGLSVRLA
jgi:hypothetical protein